MKISVVIPVYNQEKYIDKCLQSIMNQKFTDFEVICVDDCSTDQSYSILIQYTQKYNNIMIISNEKNRGLSYSRNIGIKNSFGDYIIFIDSDDWLVNENVLRNLYETAIEKELDLLRYRLTTDEFIFSMEEGCYSGKECFRYLMENNAYKWESVRNFVRRDFIIKNEIYFNEKIYGCEDVLFSTQCLLKSKKCLEINSKWYFYNRHDGSITKSKLLSRNVEGNLILINELMYVCEKEKNKIVKFSIFNLIQQVINIGNSILWNLDENLQKKDWEYESIKLYDSLFKYGNLIVKDLIFCNWESLNNRKDIYLYGAGKAAEEMWINTKNRIKYAGIILTNVNMCLKIWNNINIYTVTDRNINRNGLVLICIKGNEQKKVIELLRKSNYKNILAIGKN